MKISLTNLSGKFKALQYGPTIRPSRDWLILLALAILLFLASVFWNLWIFTKVINGESIGSQAAPSPVHKVELDTLNSSFEHRAQEAERYLREYRFIDPSVSAR